MNVKGVFMKRNMSLIMVFLFGCATAKMVEYVSFQDAVAKTGRRCHYAISSSAALGFLIYNKEIGIKEIGHPASDNREESRAFIKAGWKPVSLGGGGGNTSEVLWKKCK